MMYYVYVLYDPKRKRFYTGYTRNLQKRIKEDQGGKVFATRNIEIFFLVYYEACLNKYDGHKREKYLKSGPGKRYLKKRLKNTLKDINLSLVPVKTLVRDFISKGT